MFCGYIRKISNFGGVLSSNPVEIECIYCNIFTYSAKAFNNPSNILLKAIKSPMFLKDIKKISKFLETFRYFFIYISEYRSPS